MKKNIKYLVLLLTVLAPQVLACPFTMINDGKQIMLVVDVQNKQAVFIEPGRSAHIDPTLHGWRKYLRQETLDIYLEKKGHKNVFERHYRFTEKYCLADAENKISLSDIERLVKNPTDRMRVQAFTPREQ